MVLNMRLFVVLATAAAAIIMVTQAALAQGNPGGTRPGWGYGDNNHTHTGPPGQSVRP
ncbi:MAG: hypothetical protein Q8Q49_05140 [bacterium]|nr:hypothetical protein [bacterium]